MRHLIRVKRKLVKDLVSLPENHTDKEDLIDEIRNLDEIISNGTDSIIRDEWRKSCDSLNSIKDPKQYWSKFSRLVGTFKTKIYADIKLNDKTAINDQDRADFFATHMSNTCKTPEGNEYNQEHKDNVDKFVNSNHSIFKPQNETETNEDINPDNPDDITIPPEKVEETNVNEKLIKTITPEEIKKHVKKTPNKAPGDKVFVQHLKIGTDKLFKVLAIIYNASLKLGYFADKWKISIITMILKPNKESSNPSSYRPISLLPT